MVSCNRIYAEFRGSTFYLHKLQFRPDFPHDLIRRATDIHGDGILRLLQIGELAGQNLVIGKVPVPLFEPLVNQFIASLEINQPYRRPNAPQGCPHRESASLYSTQSQGEERLQAARPGDEVDEAQAR